MSNGRVLMGQQSGQFVIKLTGDVRMSLCTTLDTCLNDMLNNPDFSSVIVDLNEAEGIDSTTLGLLAKISRLSSPITGHIPLLVSTQPDITRIVESMGFKDRVYTIVCQQDLLDDSHLVQADMSPLDEQQARLRVLEAHKILMSLNDTNKAAFKDLVNCIEGELH